MKTKEQNKFEDAWKHYADSHITPGNPNGKLLSEQLVSIVPMQHNRESFELELLTNESFRNKWGYGCVGKLTLEERALLFAEIWAKRVNENTHNFYDKNNITKYIIVE